MNVRAYRIERREEECDCSWCGWPLDLGDKAFEIVVDGDTAEAGFCSRRCAQEAWRRTDREG